MEVIDKSQPEYSFSVSMETAMEKLRKQSLRFSSLSGFKPSEVLNIPPGDPVF